MQYDWETVILDMWCDIVTSEANETTHQVIKILSCSRLQLILYTNFSSKMRAISALLTEFYISFKTIIHVNNHKTPFFASS